MIRAGILLGFVLWLGACHSSPPAKPELLVAAAANLTEVFESVGPQFERETGIRPVFSFGSTAQLTQQIENGAPMDVFAAADAEHVQQLENKGLLAPGSRAVYATGTLALWIPSAAVTRPQDLTRPEIRVIAVAKPELAPYGRATLETLRKLGIWDQVQSKVVYTENINMAKQYGTSNNADAVFTAYSLVLHEGGRVIPIAEQLHRPIAQELGIVANTPHPDAARKFADFLLTGGGREILSRSGYKPVR